MARSESASLALETSFDQRVEAGAAATRVPVSVDDLDAPLLFQLRIVGQRIAKQAPRARRGERLRRQPHALLVRREARLQEGQHRLCQALRVAVEVTEVNSPAQRAQPRDAAGAALRDHCGIHAPSPRGEPPPTAARAPACLLLLWM